MAKTTYSEKLKDPRWQRKRLEIMERDSFKCVKCGSDKTELQVHHKTYKSGAEPWEYPDDNFETMCVNCHKLNHHKVRITENDGIINPEDLILKLGNFSRCVSEIGNHEGCWTIQLNRNDTSDNILRFLSLLSGYAWFDYDFHISTHSGDTITINEISQCYRYYFEYYSIGSMLNELNEEYDKLIDINQIYNKPVAI